MADEQTLGEFIEEHVPNVGDTAIVAGYHVRNAGRWPIDDETRAALAAEAAGEWLAEEEANEIADKDRAERGERYEDWRAR
jgi:hypothetical protein